MPDQENTIALHGHLMVAVQAWQKLSPGGFAADGGDRDMPHCRIGLGAMPMAIAGLYVHDITDINLTLPVLVCDHPRARGHDQYLVAVMRMPARRAALAEVHDAAVIIRGVPRLDDGLARPRNGSGPPFDHVGALYRNIRYVFERDHLHDDFSPPCRRGKVTEIGNSSLLSWLGCIRPLRQ